MRSSLNRVSFIALRSRFYTQRTGVLGSITFGLQTQRHSSSLSLSRATQIINKHKMSAENKQPWHSWPYELPHHNEIRKCEEYAWLHDETRSREMHQELRARALTTLRSKLSQESQQNAAVLMMGGTSTDFELYDTDVDKVEFRQESFFQYLFAIVEPDCYGAIDLVRGETLLFVPEVTDDSQRWNGTRRPLEYYTQRYGVTSTHLAKDLHTVLQSRGIKHLHTLHGMNSDSGNHTRTESTFPEISSYTKDNTQLHPILTELRVIKTEREIALMRIGTLISSQAHVYVMRHIKPGMTELQLEALFKSWVHYHGGTRHCAYTCICGSGANGSVLHYGHAARPNDRILQNGDTVVLDMGAEYQGYATDLTRSFAISGHYTADQRAIHDAVYDAQQQVMKSMKPGTSWPKMHQLAERVIIQHLIKIGILKGTVDECMSANMGSVFMPHGLGHMLGMDVHDVGGYLPGTGRAPTPGLCWLRCGRTLEAGMVLTVEPGVYFNDPWLDKALANPEQAKYLDVNVLKRFRGTGGCRLEDDVVVTKDGIENFSIMPTSVDEIEAVIQAAHAKK